ncbi:MAG: hypothetical protein BGO59_24905 [Spirosoma sp. 48-14]|nr:MAG: hypothetical protein BGO59_24905 [Spirosoma sp. 48-14]
MVFFDQNRDLIDKSFAYQLNTDLYEWPNYLKDNYPTLNRFIVVANCLWSDNSLLIQSITRDLPAS